jgi:hypothetical protein
MYCGSEENNFALFAVWNKPKLDRNAAVSSSSASKGTLAVFTFIEPNCNFMLAAIVGVSARSREKIGPCCCSLPPRFAWPFL